MQPLRFTFENKDYFIQFAYKKDEKAWAESVAKNSKWTPKMLRVINEAVDSIAHANGIQKGCLVELSDLETPPKLLHNNVTICEILRGNVGVRTNLGLERFNRPAPHAMQSKSHFSSR